MPLGMKVSTRLSRSGSTMRSAGKYSAALRAAGPVRPSAVRPLRALVNASATGLAQAGSGSTISIARRSTHIAIAACHTSGGTTV